MEFRDHLIAGVVFSCDHVANPEGCVVGLLGTVANGVTVWTDSVMVCKSIPASHALSDKVGTSIDNHIDQYCTH